MMKTITHRCDRRIEKEPRCWEVMKQNSPKVIPYNTNISSIRNKHSLDKRAVLAGNTRGEGVVVNSPSTSS